MCVHAFALCMTTKIMILVLGEVNFQFLKSWKRVLFVIIFAYVEKFEKSCDTLLLQIKKKKKNPNLNIMHNL